MNFAALLTKYMKRIGISDQQLADRIEERLPYNRERKTSRQTIYKWRTGETMRPTCEKVAKCAEVLRLDSRECNEFFQAAGCPAQNNYDYASEIEDGPLVPVTTRPIIHPRQFFGREALLKRIFNEWRQLPLQHVAVCGPKLSGKTSLLNYIRYIHNHNDNTLCQGQRYDWLKQRYSWVFVDFLQINRP
ncbi:MAG: helix-turn-helix transcriptional regulator [Pseudomonadota bacterium]